MTRDSPGDWAADCFAGRGRNDAGETDANDTDAILDMASTLLGFAGDTTDANRPGDVRTTTNAGTKTLTGTQLNATELNEGGHTQ